MEIAVWIVAGALVLGLVIWTGNKTLRSGGAAGSGASDALGNFIDVFDPARSRADRDLKDWENTGPVIPSPDEDDPPVTVDLKNNRATIRRR